MAKTDESCNNEVIAIVDAHLKFSRKQVILSLTIPFLIIAGIATITYSSKL